MTTPSALVHSNEQEAIVQERLLSGQNVDEALLRNLIAKLTQNGGEAADIFLESTHREDWAFEEGRLSGGSFSMIAGAGVRTISQDRTSFAYTAEISDRALTRAALVVAGVDSWAGEGVVALPRLSEDFGRRTLYGAANPVSGDAGAKSALLHKLDAMARAADPRIVKVSGNLSCEHQVMLVARDDGVLATDIRPLIRLTVSVIAEKTGRRERGSAGAGGRYDVNELSDERIETLVKRAVEIAVINLDARAAPAGPMTVVLGSGFPGVLIHEAVGHGLEGDYNRKETSAFTGRLGERVAAPGVTVIDDGTIGGARGSLNVDDEGETTQRTVLIEDGYLVGYLQDGLNARLMNARRTGNARRQSYAHLPMPRMTNTFLAPGQANPQDIIRSVKTGIFAKEFGGGSVDITSGKFNFSTTEAYLIEDGRITAPIKGATLIGSGPTALKDVTLIGADFALDTGTAVCTKNGQNLPVGVGQPTIRIDNMTVGGSA